MDEIVSKLKTAQHIVILPHVNADGDALGSSLALAIILDKLGKRVRIYLEEAIPDIYGFLPWKELAEVYAEESEQADVAVALDTGDRERLGRRAAVLDSANITINLDHHTTNNFFAAFNYVDAGASAVGEIIYHLIRLLGEKLTPNAALCLYTAIATDTGGFRYSNTTAVTHQIAGDLIKNGVDVAEISRVLFETTTLQKTRLMGLTIQTLELLEEGKVAFLTVTEDMLRQAGAREEDCDGLVNLGRNIAGVEASALFKQRVNGEVKVNLRSKKHLDVASIAARYGGGGHVRAAGFTVNEDLQTLRSKILDDMKSGL